MLSIIGLQKLKFVLTSVYGKIVKAYMHKINCILTWLQMIVFCLPLIISRVFIIFPYESSQTPLLYCTCPGNFLVNI